MKKLFLLMSMIFALVLLSGCDSNSGNNKQFDKEDIVVKVTTPEIRTLERFASFSGRLEGAKDVMIFPQMPGTIEKIYVEVGDKVGVGRLLVRMADETLKQTEAQYNVARQTYDRMKALHDDSLIAPQNYDQAKAGYQAAKAGYERVLENTELRAPFAGTIVGKYFNEHDTYAPGRRGILRLAKTKRLKLPIKVATGDYPKLREGMKAHVRLDALPDTIFYGELVNLSPGADPITGLFDADIILDNSGNKLPVGVFVEADIILRSVSNALTIPRSAVISDSIVFVVESGKARRRVVQTGIVRLDIVEVTDGLAPGEVVISEGALGLKNGMAVKATGEVAQ